MHVEIRALLEEKDENEGLGLTLVEGAAGLGGKLASPRVQKPGLALAGFATEIHPNRVQVFGATEIAFLEARAPETQQAAVRRLLEAGAACMVVTKGLSPPKALVEEAARAGVPLLRTELGTHVLIERVTKRLELLLAPRTRVHGVLLDVFEVGVLLRGKTGIGKSECALDLILRGHKLVADDLVEISKRGPRTLVGEGVDAIKYHMEIRGLGILNVRELFGIAAIRDAKKIELVIELTAWEEGREYDRLGLDDATTAILETDVPFVQMPVSPARNISTLIEVAARNQALKSMGFNAAREFQKRLLARNLGKEP